MSEETLSSRAPSLPMPMIQKSIGAPVAVRGAPWRSSCSARAKASAASSVTSASSVIARVTVSTEACCSTSSTTRRSITSWRTMRSAEASGRPCASTVCSAASIVSRTGSPGGSQARESPRTRRTRCT